MLVYESGLNAYVLCATTELSTKVISDFPGTCALKINHSTLFGLEIAKKLNFVSAGVEGKCVYKDSKNIFFDKDSKERDLFNTMKKENSPTTHATINEIVCGNEIFSKHLKYAHQQEYRFCWFSKHHIKNNIIINCPEAIQFCEPIYF